MSGFYPLRVTDIRRETRNAAVLTLQPADQDLANFAFVQGQYLTFRRAFDGVELRRSYSICSGVDDGALRVAVKRVEGGVFSHWVNTGLRVGDVLEAMPPMGNFHYTLDPGASRHYLGFAAGSGITPMLSNLKTILAREPSSRFTLVYANRQVQSIMFREELDDLKDRYLSRLSIFHILKTNAQDIELFTGRIDAAKCAALFRVWIDIASVDAALICGPEPMMLELAHVLRTHGLSEDRIKYELFGVQQVRRAQVVDADATACEVRITVDGATHPIYMRNRGQSVLDAALANHIDAPYACKAGVCSTCRARVTEGEVEMIANHALEDYEVRQGYVLTCQSHPVSDRLAITYDH